MTMRIMKWIVGLFVKPKVDTDTEYVGHHVFDL